MSTSQTNNNAEHSVSVSCPAGKVVLGGGASTSGPGGATFVISSSYPSSTTAWSASASRLGTSGNWTLNVWAICATTS